MIKNIIFDFDGVILESNDVKIDGFYKLFESFGESNANMISQYFKNNAGLSRYDIIKYFFLEVCNKNINDEMLYKYSNKYSAIVKDKVIKTKFVDGFKSFVSEYYEYKLFVVSSSDEQDLKYICERLNILKYFREILGSPIKKDINIAHIVDKYNLQKKETIYIGDSITEYYATVKNDLTFVGRNSGVYDFNTIKLGMIIENLVNLNENIKELKC